MKFRLNLALLLVAGCVSAAAVRADSDTPYRTIIERNVFGLVPIPTNPPVDTTPAVPPPKITPNGIMTLFGKLQVLFKVAEPGKPGQPAKDESYTMSEGDRQNEIEVQKIDEAKAIITFDNHGVIQALPLVASTAGGGGGPAGGGAPGFAPPGVMGGAGPMGGGGGPFGMAGRFGRNRSIAPPAPGPSTPDAAQPSDGSMLQGTENMTPTTGGFVNSRGIFQPAAPQMSPEEQALMIEAQRLKYQQDGNPMAPMLPPTALGRQMQNEAPNPMVPNP